MTVRGYVYVLTNEGMPDLIKIGFSLKDPALRAKELSTTGVPHPYVVVYDILVHDPIEVEQAVHRAFREEGRHAVKEFFRASVSDVITKINQVIAAQGKTGLLESNSTQSQPRVPSSPPATTQCRDPNPRSILGLDRFDYKVIPESTEPGAPDWKDARAKLVTDTEDRAALAKKPRGNLICPRCRATYNHRTHCNACQVALVPLASIIDTGAAFYCPECGKDSDRDTFCRYCQSKVVRRR